MKKSSYINKMSFSTIHIFRKHVMQKKSFANQQNGIASSEAFVSIEFSFVSWKVLYKYCDKSFIRNLILEIFASINWKNLPQKHNMIL